MKQSEKDSRRGGSARQVHHKHIGLGVFCKKTSGVFMMGLTQDRLGQE